MSSNIFSHKNYLLFEMNLMEKVSTEWMSSTEYHVLNTIGFCK